MLLNFYLLPLHTPSTCAQTTTLYDKTSDAQEGAISMLIEDMAEQQLKEAVLAYAILYMSGDKGKESTHEEAAGVTEHQLDLLCEDFLLMHFGLKVIGVEGGLLRVIGVLLGVTSEAGGQSVAVRQSRKTRFLPNLP